jgi:hypothetical protein
MQAQYECHTTTAVDLSMNSGMLRFRGAFARQLATTRRNEKITLVAIETAVSHT